MTQDHTADHPEDDIVEGDEDQDEGEDEGGGDAAGLALDVPEPAQAVAADALLAAAGKGKKGLKGKGKGAKGKGALEVAIGDDVIGLEDPAAEEDADAETEGYSTAYGSDEITDLESDEIDPLTMVLGAGERPWQNEKLSVVEQMMTPGYRRQMDALQKDNDATNDAPARRDAQARKIGAAIAVAAIAAATQVGNAYAGPAPAKQDGPGLAGVARGPQRAAEQDQPRPATESTRQQNQNQNQNKTEITTRQARQNADDVTLRRIGSGLAPSVGITAASVATGNAFDRSPAAVTTATGMDPLDLLQMQDDANALSGTSGAGMTIQTPNSPAAESRFALTLGMIYDTLGQNVLMNVSPYRAAGWDEKRLEQKENSRDVTIAPPAAATKAPAPEPAYQRDMQMNLGPSGPG